MLTSRKLWWGVVLGIFLAGAVGAQTVRTVPVPPHIKPQWTPVPESPKVFSAPNVPADVFRGPGGYYLSLGPAWYHSRTLNGPWTMVHQAPDFLAAIGPGSFKSPRAGAAKKPGTEAAPAAPTAAAPAVGAVPAAPATPQVGATAALTPGTPPAATAAPAATPAPGATPSPAAQAEAPAAPAPEPIFLDDPGPP